MFEVANGIRPRAMDVLVEGVVGHAGSGDRSFANKKNDLENGMDR